MNRLARMQHKNLQQKFKRNNVLKVKNPRHKLRLGRYVVGRLDMSTVLYAF
jgi:hypothetical protein